MKRIFTLVAFFALAGISYAQQDTVWRSGGLFSLNFSQAALTNWAAGGQNSIAGNSLVSLYANYKKGNIAWDNNLDLAFGLMMQGEDAKVVKSDDKIDLSSKYGIKASTNWYYSLLFNFRSQFAYGYNYPNDSEIISKFLAPGYVMFALGMDFKPNDYFSVFLSPATTRFLIVNDKSLSDAGAFGVDTGKTLKTEVGAYLKSTFNKDLSSTVNLKTSIDFFSNYFEDPQNIDVNWQLLLALKVSKFITASLSIQLIYDDNTKVAVYKSDGITIEGYGPRTQFKEIIGIGFAYKFSSVGLR